MGAAALSDDGTPHIVVAAKEPVGPPARLEDVFRRHHDHVWGVARGLGATPVQADDVVQEVFLVVRRRLHEHNVGGSLRAWLAGITRRVLADQRKKQRRAAQREARGEPPRSIDDPSRKIVADERARAVADFLDSLPPEQREVFVLMDIEGMSTREVADATDTKPNTVSSRRRLARQRFEVFAGEWKRREDATT